jgi:hypothetical protein
VVLLFYWFNSFLRLRPSEGRSASSIRIRFIEESSNIDVDWSIREGLVSFRLSYKYSIGAQAAASTIPPSEASYLPLHARSVLGLRGGGRQCLVKSCRSLLPCLTSRMSLHH